MSDSLRPHEPQHASPPWPLATPGAYPNPCPLCWWCHPTISSSVVPFFSCSQSLPTSGSFPRSQLFTSGGQSIVYIYIYIFHLFIYQIRSDQSLSRIRLFVTPWTAACQASLSIANCQSPPKPMSIELVMPSNHLILCRPLFCLPSSFPASEPF